jgi:hypothetical protein
MLEAKLDIAATRAASDGDLNSLRRCTHAQPHAQGDQPRCKREFHARFVLDAINMAVQDIFCEYLRQELA